jgi:hypothetical protein
MLSKRKGFRCTQQSYRPAEPKQKAKTVHKFTQVKIQSNENNEKISSPKVELPVVKVDKIIDPVWLAKFLFTLNNCK